MIICSVGRCPVDGKNPICCRHCDKNIDCKSACKRTNKACLLKLSKDTNKKESSAKDPKEIKIVNPIITKESEVVQLENKHRQALESVLMNLRSIDGPNEADSYINDSIEIITNVLKDGDIDA